ncbi:MAG TPA: MiaB/RimO family radical SAM methylthiotransferase [Terracidiphilus sp.]|nr:MiaB/RimO family radical SAM methylthiotransferase [Terracidiphilus sp.]
MPPLFHVEHFGCRAARADGEAIAERLRTSGLSESGPAQADVVIVNTCSVTAEADREARAFIRRARRRNPAARILVTGCYAQRAPEELAAIPGVSAVVGNSHKALAPNIAFALAQREPVSVDSPIVPLSSVLSASNRAPILSDDSFAHSFLEEARLIPGAQTRPNLKIQEGCSNRCSFCVIPQTRGSSRSLPAAQVLARVRQFVADGGRELVFSGINLGRWGRDLAPTSQLPRPTLAALVRLILERTSLPRLRLSSIEPMDWDADLLALFRDFSAGARLCPHAHLPLQSGSDSLLRRMHRRYRPWHYEQKVADILAAAGPDLTLGADVMAGFPGETDSEFADTVALIRALPFGYLHLFPFSPRPGTHAWTLHAESPVPAALVHERMAALRQLAHEKSLAHRRRFLGRALPAITLQTPPALAALGRTAALTANFLPVELDAALPANQLLTAHITDLSPGDSLRAAVSAPAPAALAVV